ncbi:defects in morphology protein 1precursor [Rhizoctonia solani AG-3 Rhs1AP]|uniref:Defects in morphology protein 1precursor n=1 Tax=Rhizoctonia solani AG-3 Rhs1AP TaxID=1086054 RepID=X8JVG5_9AGAM|nr:defects in morphology protein 1precursor [Rhizoctonia solani AG-3 Rhs1AP]
MSQYAQVDLSISTLFNVKDKIALVSGGGSGIGFMIASALIQNGAKVYIASRKEKQLQEAQKALNEKGPGRCEYIVADLGSKAGCEALCDAFKTREPKLHILVNNSGATWGAPWDNFPEKEAWDRVMALNVKSLFYMTSGLSELLQKDATALDPGRVVNISSVAGKDPVAHDTGLANKGQGLWSYNTSKAAANHLTTTMAVTLAPKFITVNAILPGVYPSKMTAFGFSKAAGALAKSHPMGRVGAPTDMAGLFLFLVSPGGAHITGAHIESDGGSRISGRGYSLFALGVGTFKMSDHTDDEYEFTEFTEKELQAIDSTAEAALGTVCPISSSDPQIATRLDPLAVQEDPPRSRKSSGFSTFDLTEEELQLIDRSVAHLVSETDASPSSVGESLTQSARPQPFYVEVSLESLPSTVVGSPAPTLGRSPSPSPLEMASLYSRFRAARNSLSVSDLVAPAWCEVQFDYGLRGKRYLPPSMRPKVLETRSGKKIQVQREVAVENDRVLKKGTAVHKKLEREIRPIEVEITPKTREDAWGLRLLNMISNIRVLVDEGCCREMPVVGFVHGHLVIGVIDELLLTPNISQSSSSGGSPTQESSCYPSSGSNASEWAGGTIHILDNKTRGTNNLPRSRDALQSRLQLMLYKRLLDILLVPANIGSAEGGAINQQRLSFPDVWTHHSLDSSACFSPSFLQESSALVFSNNLGPAAENAVCLNDLEGVWNTTINELIHTIHPTEQGSMVSNVLKLVYRRRDMPKKRSVRTGNGSQATSRASSPETQYNELRHTKKGRAESEDVELQRAIHESLRHSVRSDGFTLQDETSEVMGRQKKDESQGLIQEAEDPARVPGGWISPEDDLRRAIDESKKSYRKQMGREALSPFPPPLDVRKRENDQNVIGVIEFDHNDALLDGHLTSVLDFWHDRRPPRGVDMEDTGRCRYCEFSEGCEWLEAKAEEITQETPKRR